ncbi:unnamed protein product [Plutella xylostella]|uniref:(diamondback moth) hypothetical protein n=1 Tax=Plutella xylostella TaxID=51655 RepID=A0A8S4ELI6_PLUXY|nr:unnamed protein product [Plutella xylostella]
MLAECESEKSKWVVALGELHRILRRNQPPDRQVRCVTTDSILRRNQPPDRQVRCVTTRIYRDSILVFTAMLAFDSSTISNIRSLTSACVLDMGGVLTAGGGGLALLDAARREVTPRRAHAPHHAARRVPRDQLIVSLQHPPLTSACVLDMGGVLTAGGGGLALLDAARREVTPRRAHAPHHAARRVPRDQLIVTIAGRGRYVRLVPLRALECADVECVKVRDSKGAIDICVGEISDRAMGFACVCKRQNAYIVNVYEITRTAARRVRIAELRAPSAVLSIQLWRGALVLGHRGGFVMHQLPPRDAPPIKMEIGIINRVYIAELRAPSAVLSVQLWRGALVLGHRGGFVMHQLPPRDAPPISE